MKIQETRHRPLERSTADPATSANRNSCLLMLAIYAVLSVVYTLVLQTRIEAAALPLALVLAVFGTLFVGSAISVVVWPAEIRWLRAAQRGEWPDDGALCAISGRLEGDPQPAPISGDSALAWTVDVYRKRYSTTQRRTRKITKLKAMGRRRIVLDGPAGPARLLGLVDLDGVKPKSWPAEKVKPAASALLHRGEARPFAETLADVGAALDAFATRDEVYEKVRFNPTGGAPAPGDRVEERVLEAGQEVCALGIFDRRAGTLDGRYELGVRRVQILPGSPQRAAARLMRKTWLGLAAMAFLFLLSHGLIGAVIFL